MDRREFISSAAALVAIREKAVTPNPMIAEKDRFPRADSEVGAFISGHRAKHLVVVEGFHYDRIAIPSGFVMRAISPLHFFVDVGVNKGPDRTSLYHSRRLEAPEEFLALGVNLVAHSSMCDEDHAALEKFAWWELIIGQRRYGGAPALLSGEHSVERAGGLHISWQQEFWGSLLAREDYTFKADADILFALRGIRAQGVC